MAYTVSGNKGSSTIDLSAINKTPMQYSRLYEETFTSGIVEKIIVVDPRLDKSLQINVGTGTIAFDLWVTTTEGDLGSGDITHASTPWIQIEDDKVLDYLSGGANINKGILAIRILSATITSDSVKVCVCNLI